MAKIAKNEMSVKGALADYNCTWTYKPELKDWPIEALLANIDQGLKYVIRKMIGDSIEVDEQLVPKWKFAYDHMMAATKGDAEEIKKVEAVCAQTGMKGEITTVFVFEPKDFMKVITEADLKTKSGKELPQVVESAPGVTEPITVDGAEVANVVNV